MFTNATAYTTWIDSDPHAASAGRTATVTPWHATARTIARRRSTRSTHAPITRPNSRYGANPEAVVSANSTGEPVSWNARRAGRRS
ncbi:hypothetical protein NKH77_01025 [Streptomyces sp. M19]